MPDRVLALTRRELNRALLARQFLLKRRKLDVVDAVERLACLQGQWAPSPYVPLWPRLSGFQRERLTRPIDRGEIVKATLMRATLHLVSAREYPAYSLATMEGRFGAWRPPGRPALADLGKLHRAVMTFAGKTPRTRAEIQEFAASHLPPSAAKNERLRNWLRRAARSRGARADAHPAGGVSEGCDLLGRGLAHIPRRRVRRGSVDHRGATEGGGARAQAVQAPRPPRSRGARRGGRRARSFLRT